MGIARFLVGRMELFPTLADRADDFNAHCPTLDRYRRMLAAFKPIRRTLPGREMNAAELIRVLGAGEGPIML